MKEGQQPTKPEKPCMACGQPCEESDEIMVATWGRPDLLRLDFCCQSCLNKGIKLTILDNQHTDEDE